MKEAQSKEKKKNWILPTCLALIVFLGFIWFLSSTPTPSKIVQENKPKYLEVDISELYASFSDMSPYSEIQKEDLYNKAYKDKLLKTSIRADRINKASLGSQYVVLEMRDRFSCIAKAFFPSSEKDKLLKANVGSTIVFAGELKAYKYGFASCVEFGDAKVLEIK